MAYYPSGPVDPLAAAIAEMFSAAPLSTLPLESTRGMLAAGCAMTGQPEMPASDHAVPVAGGEIVVRLYRPATNVPALIAWSHGGGFALGTLDEADNFCRLLAARSGAAVASIGYRLAPEHRFPTAVEDVEAAVLWLVANRAQLGLGDVPVWLGGDSAGGNLSTVVTRRLHEAGSTRIAGNLLVYPCTDSPDADSLRRFEPPFMRVEEVSWFIDMYLPGPEFRLHPDFAPLHAGGLDNLPPTFVLTAEHDVITEQAEAYGMKLAGLGVPVQIERVPGQIHGFVTLDPFLPGAAGDAVDRMVAFMQSVS